MELPDWLPATARADLQRLLTAVLRVTDRRIRWSGRFYWYVFELTGSEPTQVTDVDFDTYRDQVSSRLSPECRAVAVAYDSRLKEESIDAVVVELSHVEAPPVLVVLRYRNRGILRKVWYADPQIGPLRAAH
ncbi:hypothetical protein [Fodinicola acaciae]|uniref:hypothetical protein n=1 Tax=Fodinicola acaciae TaxID=2681555 RepID=UPI0013D03E5E|nr:hypothetical protein [Fodinicola acaciae]